MKNTLIEIKAIFTAFFAIISSWLGILTIPMAILIAFNFCDFLTALAAAKNRDNPIQSKVFFVGIVKKLCMWLMVGMGSAVDWLIQFSADTIGISIAFTMPVAITVAVWLIINEAISILENIDDIGGTVPPFLRKLIEMLHRATEDKANIGKEDNDHA